MPEETQPNPAETQVITTVKGLFADFVKAANGQYVTLAAMKEFGDTLTSTLNAAQAKQQADWEAKSEEKITRAVRERTAKPPFGAAGADGDVRTLGQRFIDTPEFKALAASFQTGGITRNTRATLSVQGRIRNIEQRAVTLAGSGYVVPPVQVGVFSQPEPALVVRDLLTTVPLTASNAIEYLEETWTYAADYQVTEGAKKAEGTVSYLEKTLSAKTIAWFVKASRQMMSDAAYFASTVDAQLIYGVLKKEDYELLWGDGLAGHITGLMPAATALPADVLEGATTGIDLIASGIAYLASLGYAATGIVMNPLDWAQLQISKTEQGVYLLGGPPQGNAVPRLWGLPVVGTMNMTRGTALIGAFPPNATLFDRESPNVDVAYENEDDFVKNMVTIRAEERILLAIFRPQAFVKVTIPPPVIP